MFHTKFIFIPLIVLTIIFQGCGSDTNNTTSYYQTAIGESASIVSGEPNATMAPSQQALDILTNKIGNILKIHIVEINEKEATTFSKETNYCDISGEKILENAGDITEIVSNNIYTLCQNETNIQNGTIKINYLESNSEGKFPHSLVLNIEELYTFNKMIFKENVVIKGSNITYAEDGSLENIDLDISGNIEYDYQTLLLTNLTQTISF